MVDSTYQTKVYHKRGGDEIVIAKGGLITVEPGGDVSFPNPSGAQDYFVDGNASSSGDGLTWPTAVQSLSEAISLSNTSIGLSANRWWARRNRIFCCGDTELNENLTVLPEKCDIIGTGYDIHSFPRVIGNHVIAAATKGVRFINMGFTREAASDHFVFPSGCHGLSFIGCFLEAGVASRAYKCLEITSCSHVRILNTAITSSSGVALTRFGTAISIEGTTDIHDWVIEHCRIFASVGIHVVEATANSNGSLIKNNSIRASGLTVNDASDDFILEDNKLYTEVDCNGGFVNGVVSNADLAANNVLTHAGTDLCEHYPFIKDA